MEIKGLNVLKFRERNIFDEHDDHDDHDGHAKKKKDDMTITMTTTMTC